MKNMCPTALWHTDQTQIAGATTKEFLKDTKFTDEEHVPNCGKRIQRIDITCWVLVDSISTEKYTNSVEKAARRCAKSSEEIDGLCGLVRATGLSVAFGATRSCTHRQILSASKNVALVLTIRSTTVPICK